MESEIGLDESEIDNAQLSIKAFDTWNSDSSLEEDDQTLNQIKIEVDPFNVTEMEAQDFHYEAYQITQEQWNRDK